MGYLTDLLGSRAVDVINGYRKSRQPFLMSLHFNAPHWPWEAPGDESESRRIASTDLRDYDGGTQRTYRTRDTEYCHDCHRTCSNSDKA